MKKSRIRKLLKSIESQTWLAEELTRVTGARHSRQAVNNWFRLGSIPAAKIGAVARITGLSEDELRD